MPRTLLLNVKDPEERRAALLEDGRLSLLWVERDDDRSLVGNVYLARVLRVEPSIGAAFVDLGIDRPGFLPANDAFTPPVTDDAPPGDVAAPGDLAAPAPSDDSAVRRSSADSAAEPAESGVAAATLAAPPLVIPAIDELFKPGETVVVQVSRDAIGRKGPTVTTHLSFPGRTLVLFPSIGRRAVSKKIEDEATRRRIHETLESLGFADGVGVVARTAFADADKSEIEGEAARLMAISRRVADGATSANAPALLHEEAEFVTRAVRELAIRAPEGSEPPLRIVADTADGTERARAALGSVGPGVEILHHAEALPIFHAFGVERLVRELDDPRVPLPGGGSLVIDQTEAMWTIDVNSGRLRTLATIEETALETDLLAAREAARQIRLRDLSGLVAVDFIDCRDEVNRQRVAAEFRAELAKDPARLRAADMSEFMTMEITRRRLRSGAARSGSVVCSSCRGRGAVHSPAAASLRLLRDIRAAAASTSPKGVEIRCAAAVATDLERRKPELDQLRAAGLRAEVVIVPGAPSDWFEVRRR